MKYIFFFNNFSTIISFIIYLILAVPYIFKGYNYFTKKRYIKKVLGFKKETVQLTHATYYLSTSPGTFDNFIPCAALDAANNIIYLLNEIKQKYELIDLKKDIKHEINIGGFMTNKHVNAYFSKYFKEFKYFVNIKHKEEFDSFPIDKNIVKYSSDKYGFKLNDEIFLETSSKISDYAFLIKLTKDDFKDDNQRIVHILFGGTALGTLKATEFLLTHSKKIYERYGSNHYFFALKINQIDNSIDFSKENGINDYTSIMFKQT